MRTWGWTAVLCALVVVTSSRRPFVEFLARRYAAGIRPAARGISFEASLFEPGRVSVNLAVWAAADTSTFRQPEPATAPENLTLTPPPPFAGSGSLRRTDESTFAWEGDLGVAFPGVRPVALAGPAFSTHFCALRGCVDQFPPEEEVEGRGASGS